MALFDRRLLAYFDDGLGAGGSMTLLDRITDYQRDLAEIERELSKYQVLLGNRQVQYRHRDRDGWIAKNREQKTIKERYRRVAQAMGEGHNVVPERMDAQAEEIIEQSQRRGSFSRKAKELARGSRGSLGTGTRGSPGAATGKSVTVWVQIDTVSGLPPPRSAAYVVRAAWLGISDRQLLAETDERPSERDANGDEKCVIRQQLKLEGHPGSHVVKVSIHRREDGPLALVGECSLDANDSYNHEVQYHPLSDERGPLTSSRTDDMGRPVATTVRLRLTQAAPAPQPAAREQKTGGRNSATRQSIQAPAGEAATKRSSVASTRERRSSEDRGQRRNSGTRETGLAAATVVTQDPVVPQRRLSAGSGRGGEHGAAAAAAVAASEAASEASPSRADPTPAETPVSQGLTEGETYEEVFEEEVEESEGGETDVIYEEEEEEELEGDEEEAG